eukprot:54374-Eustigmatos_ZCMA.PRE.1
MMTQLDDGRAGDDLVYVTLQFYPGLMVSRPPTANCIGLTSANIVYKTKDERRQKVRRRAQSLTSMLKSHS